LEKLKFNEAVKSILDLLATDLIENTREKAAGSGRTASKMCGVCRGVWRLSPRVATENAALKSSCSKAVQPTGHRDGP